MAISTLSSGTGHYSTLPELVGITVHDVYAYNLPKSNSSNCVLKTDRKTGYSYTVLYRLCTVKIKTLFGLFSIITVYPSLNA